jgi:hypothetical protein
MTSFIAAIVGRFGGGARLLISGKGDIPHFAVTIVKIVAALEAWSIVTAK